MISLRSVVVATAMLVLAASPATAQLGGLKDRLLKKATQKKEAPKPPESAGVASGAKATATIEWTIESVSNDLAELAQELPPTPKSKGNDASTPTLLTDKERGRIVIEFDFDPNRLPGGMVSRMGGGPMYMVGLTSGSSIGADRLLSLTGSVSFDRTARPVGTCKRLGAEAGSNAGLWLDPLTVDASGKSEYSKDGFQLMIAFQGEKPVSFDFTRSPSASSAMVGTRVTGTGSYACGSKFTVVDSLNSAGYTLAVRDGAGWKITSQKATGGYQLTATSDSTSKGTSGRLEPQTRRVIRTATLTWNAPPAPEQSAQGGMTPPPQMEASKGTITFTQKGKSATWSLHSVVDASQGGMKSKVFMYSPDGGQPSEEKGALSLAVASIMGQTMVGFNVTKGPGGDTQFENGECTVQLKPGTGSAVSGTGECKKGGTVVTFTFAAGQ